MTTGQFDGQKMGLADDSRFRLRGIADTSASAVLYVARIAPDQDTSGSYGGMAPVVFSANDAGEAAIGMVSLKLWAKVEIPRVATRSDGMTS